MLKSVGTGPFQNTESRVDDNVIEMLSLLIFGSTFHYSVIMLYITRVNI